ncbi:uncharacterized protein APUU_60830A [Aspergillus puulaauensis]|uniref:Uncharacterized protein n=1 Tax=Aspergillus puulaauensis TaxID=1220207 RepID=A0A7R7XUS7_9EURO|nr:uncharacterized protein APUU_60830A [Aspergillus puulaauensis]BCS27782.1 hypothetical protein APUU_60830A [Aspergillus puulaauensis]
MAIHIPDRSASSADVRRFITDVLVSDYDAEPDFASETASAWRIGRGTELHDANQRYFVDIFGVEIGVCLYRSVLNAREKQRQNSRTGILFKWAHLSVPILAIWNFYKSQWGRSSLPRSLFASAARFC